jgi:hypothetical protein
MCCLRVKARKVAVGGAVWPGYDERGDDVRAPPWPMA